MDLTKFFEAACRLYPTDFREAFYPEMRHTFESAYQGSRRRGKWALSRFALAELAALAFGIAAEWCVKLGNGRPATRRRFRHTESELPGSAAAVESEIAKAIDGMVHAIAHHDFSAARVYSVQEQAAREKLRLLRDSQSFRPDIA